MPRAMHLLYASYYIMKICMVLFQLILYFELTSRFTKTLEIKSATLKVPLKLPVVRPFVTRMIKEIFKVIYNDVDEVMADLSLILLIFFAYFILKLIFATAKRFFKTLKRDYLHTFDVLFEVHIRQRFRSQSEDCLSCLKNGVRTALRHKSTRRPAVILLLYTQETRQTAECLAARLLRVCLATVGRHKPPGHVEKYLTVDGEDYSTLSDFWTFYTALKDRIDSERMAIVRNFQAVHPHAVTLVSTLTHELFSPDSKAIVVLLLEMSWYDPGRLDCATRLAESMIDQAFGHALDEPARQDLFRSITARSAVVNLEPTLPKEV